ncbi:MAG: metal-dependent hydrolase [Acidobacteriota bacterium]
MPLVIGHALLGASVVAAFGNRAPGRDPDWRRQLLIGGVMGVFPDLDLFMTWILGLGIKWHGGFTHSITAALAMGFLAAIGTGKVHRTLVFGGAMFSHGLLDAMTKKTYGGTQLFWPFYSGRLKLGLFDYFAFYPDSKLDPIWKLVARALQISLYELLIFGSGFLLILFLRGRIYGSNGTTTSPTAEIANGLANGLPNASTDGMDGKEM